MQCGTFITVKLLGNLGDLISSSWKLEFKPVTNKEFVYFLIDKECLNVNAWIQVNNSRISLNHKWNPKTKGYDLGEINLKAFTLFPMKCKVYCKSKCVWMRRVAINNANISMKILSTRLEMSTPIKSRKVRISTSNIIFKL